MRSAESFEAEYERSATLARNLAKETTDQFRASLNRHIDKLIEEEQDLARTRVHSFLIHEYAASLLRELKAWLETGS